MTLSALICAAVLGQGQPDDRPRIREELSNGVKLLASNEGYASSGRACLVLYASSLGNPVPASGRHLLEHISAQGPNKDIDRRLESVGVLLQAETTRNGTWFTVSGPAAQVPLMVDSLAEIVGPTKTTVEELKREVGILAQEKAVLPRWWGFDTAGWTVAFGGNTVDPYGQSSEFESYSPESLESVRTAAYSGSVIAVTAFGDINPSVVIGRLKSAFSSLPAGPASGTALVVEAFTGRGRSVATGEARCAVVPGIGNSVTSATLGVALVLAHRSGGTVAYEPSFGAGVVTLYSPSLAGLSFIDGLTSTDRLLMANEVRSASRSWWFGQTSSLERKTRSEALVLRDGASLKFDVLVSYAAGMTDEEIQDAFSAFESERCIQVAGR